MHRSAKEKMLTRPEQQLLHPTYAEALSLSPGMADVELSGEFSSVSEQLKHTPKKSYR
jgi:hypothetical protein